MEAITKLDKRNLNAIVRKLYKTIQESGLTSKKFHDLGWEGVYAIIDKANECLEEVNKHYGCQLRCFIKDVPGYVGNINGEMHCKVYNTVVLNEDNDDATIIGNIKGYACGTVEDPWKSYDLTAMWTAEVA